MKIRVDPLHQVLLRRGRCHKHKSIREILPHDPRLSLLSAMLKRLKMWENIDITSACNPLDTHPDRLPKIPFWTKNIDIQPTCKFYVLLPRNFMRVSLTWVPLTCWGKWYAYTGHGNKEGKSVTQIHNLGKICQIRSLTESFILGRSTDRNHSC